MSKHRNSSFIIELHDVWPASMEQITDDLAVLRDWGVQNIALGVVPGLFSERDAAHLQTLHRWAQQGVELLAHGYVHRADLALPRQLWGRWVQKIAQQEAEFAGLSVEISAQLVQKSYAHWQELGLPAAVGFVAPTWWGSRAVTSTALQYWPWVESRFGLHSSQQNIPSVPFSFAGFPASITLRALQIGDQWCRWRRAIPRLVLHPGDTRREYAPAIRQTLQKWQINRKLITFKEIF